MLNDTDNRAIKTTFLRLQNQDPLHKRLQSALQYKEFPFDTKIYKL